MTEYKYLVHEHGEPIIRKAWKLFSRKETLWLEESMSMS